MVKFSDNSFFMSGIVIRRGNVQSPQFFVWQDITNLVNHKRYFGIECQNFEFSVQFLLDEPEAAKYVWKMCKIFAIIDQTKEHFYRQSQNVFWTDFIET